MRPNLAHYLKDFGPAPVSAPMDFGVADDLFPETELLTSEEPHDAVVDLEAEKQTSFSEGYDAASVELNDRHQTAIDELNSAHKLALDEALRVEREVTAKRITDAFETMTASLSRGVERACLSALIPIVQERVAVRAASAISEQVMVDISHGFSGKFKVRGPEALLEMVRDQLKAIASDAEFETSDDVDVVVEMGASVLATRLGEFVSRMEGLLDE